MVSYSKFLHTNKLLYSYKHPVSEKFRVFLNGEEIPVYTCRISKFPFNTIWPGHQRQFNQTEEAAFVNIVSDEEIKIEVITTVENEQVIIKPYSKNICHNKKDGKITFNLKENGNFVLQCGSYHNSLYIFNSKPISAPNKEDVTYYFEPGIHFTGRITLKSNESIYVDKDALIYGSVYAEDAENINIFGNGIFDDSKEERTGNYCYEEYTNGNMKFYNCNNISISGVGMTNSAEWCMSLFGCSNAILDNIKIFGQWRYNTDGVDIVNCQNIEVNNSFVHSFDDTITIKGIDRYCNIDNCNIHIKNCVLWCDWGKCCELGIETACRKYYDISFENCDVLRGGLAVMDISNGDCAEISKVTFNNINVEFNGFDTEEVYQENDDMVYNAQDKIAVPTLIQLRNIPLRTPENLKNWGIPELGDVLDLRDIKTRNINNVVVENINVFYDKLLPLENGKPIIKIAINNEIGTEKFDNIKISDIFVNEEKFF